MTADRILLTVSMFLLVGALYLLMLRGWRSRQRRQGDLPSPPAPPEVRGQVLAPAASGLFVGTTFADDWLDRVAVHDLAHRAAGWLVVATDGVHVEREGLVDLFLPYDTLDRAFLGDALAGKVVGSDGLLLLEWRLGSRLLTSGFRADDHGLHRGLADMISARLSPRHDASVGGPVTPALLVLEDGRTFRGAAYGAVGETYGEAVFNTGMTGYQETLTDPSYHRQVVVMTAPHIGNTGVNDEDPESGRIWVSGYVVREPSRLASSWRSTGSLESELQAQGVVGIRGVDTRALTRHLRDLGAMKVGIFSGDAVAHIDELQAKVDASPPMEGADLAHEVTTPVPYVVPAVGERRFTVAALDLGIKTSTPRQLALRGCEVHVLPATTTGEELLAMSPDGVFLSNGPGDPATTDGPVAAAQVVLYAGVPLFGICFGNQILGRALGLGTYKLLYGHRGMNQPVQDQRTKRVHITSHNHGFAVDAPTAYPVETPYGRVEVSHVDLNDNVVEGLNLLDTRAFSVQYHPEAAPGPHDATGLFDAFATMMEA